MKLLLVILALCIVVDTFVVVHNLMLAERKIAHIDKLFEHLVLAVEKKAEHEAALHIDRKAMHCTPQH